MSCNFMNLIVFCSFSVKLFLRILISIKLLRLKFSFNFGLAPYSEIIGSPAFQSAKTLKFKLDAIM